MRKFSNLKASVAPVVLGLAMVSSPALAQDQDAQEADAADEGLIIVTGSRIAGGSGETTAPLQIITAEAIEQSAVTNIQALLLENPVFGAPLLSRTNSSFSSANSGVATVDLRDLGTSRTLVLVNGRRHVAGIPGTSAVDLNSIPTSLIERVDVLTSGAGSAIYGSDAVAGVVNFVYKKDFEGLQADGLVGITEAGDDFRYQGSVLVGGNFDDGRGNVTLYMGYSNENGAFKRNRETEEGSSALDSISLGLLTGNNADLFTRSAPFFSSFPPQGRYTTDNSTFTYDANGALRPCFSTNGGTAPATCGAFAGQQIGPDGFNRSAFRLTATPIERYLISGTARYEISEGINFFGEASFVQSNAASRIEPFPFASDNLTDSGQYPIETLDPTSGLIVRNPFVPDAIFNDSSDTDGDGLRDIFIAKRLADFGGRNSDAKRSTFRMVAGFEGEFTEGWNYETFVTYGQTDITQLGSGQFNTLNFRAGTQIIPDGNGGFQCASADARGDGCVPINIFGLNSFADNPAALNYLAAPSVFNSTVKQTTAGANVTGSLFEIVPGAPVGITVGTEYRRESSEEAWDALQALGLNGSNAFPPTSGQFDLYEFYGEALVPLIREGIVHDFSIRGAARYSNYSTVGNTFSWNAGFELAPIEDIRIRGMYSETVRAPDISELFDGRNQTFPTVQDPCEGITADGSALSNNCLAFAGVADNLAANNGTFVVSQSARQGVTGFGGGNPGLSEEKGKTFTLGVTVNPVSIDALRNLSLVVDYYNIEISDAIVSTPRQFILNQCFVEGVQSFCNFVVRRPAAQGLNGAGTLDEVNTGPSNSGGLSTEGIDVVLAYRDTIAIGESDLNISGRISYTHVLESFSTPLPGAARDFSDGEVGEPKNRFTTNLTLGMEDWNLSLTGTYVGEAYLDDQFTAPDDPRDPDFRLHPEFYLDTQIRFLVSDEIEVFMGVDNLLNNKPQFTASIPNASDTGQESFGGSYDVLGRRFYSGAKLRF